MVWLRPGRHCCCSGVLEPAVGPIHFARKFTQPVPVPGPDRWSPLAGNRVSQRYLAAAGRHGTPGYGPLSSPPFSFHLGSLRGGADISISPLQGRPPKSIARTFLSEAKHLQLGRRQTCGLECTPQPLPVTAPSDLLVYEFTSLAYLGFDRCPSTTPPVPGPPAVPTPPTASICICPTNKRKPEMAF